MKIALKQKEAEAKAKKVTETARPIKNEGAERFRVKGSDLILKDENGKTIYAGPEKKTKKEK